MARRKQLKGIAKNITLWCLSRNNDYSGYWAVGQLYKYAHERNTHIVSVNLLNSHLNNENELISTLCSNLNKIVKHQLLKNSIPESWLKNIFVEFHFEVPYVHKYHCWGLALGMGKPMLCNVSIVTDLGRKYIGESGCNCWVHNPTKESRRYGF